MFVVVPQDAVGVEWLSADQQIYEFYGVPQDAVGVEWFSVDQQIFVFDGVQTKMYLQYFKLKQIHLKKINYILFECKF